MAQAEGGGGSGRAARALWSRDTSRHEGGRRRRAEHGGTRGRPRFRSAAVAFYSLMAFQGTGLWRKMRGNLFLARSKKISLIMTRVSPFLIMTHNSKFRSN